MTTRITSDQTKQYKRFVEDAGDRALKKVTLDKDSFQRLIERGGEFQAHVVAGIKRFTAKTPDYDLARAILGEDFISPEEIAKARGVTYTDEQLTTFGGTLPAQEEALKWCRDNGMMLIVGPPKEMSLLDLRDLKPGYFYSNTSGWYTDKAQKFARNDKAESIWIALRKGPIADSLRKTWSEQKALVTDPMIIPNAAETVWCLTTYKAVRNVYLLQTAYIRTSSVSSGGYRVDVGRFDGSGLNVSIYWGDVRDDSIGVAASRKF